MKHVSRFDEELGKAICDRLGLAHNTTLQDYITEVSGPDVWVTMTTMQHIPLDDYNELRAVAQERAAK